MSKEVQKTNTSLEERIKSLGAAFEKNIKAVEEAKKIKEELIKKTPPKQPEQQYFAFFPTQLMRTSIFFPISKKEINRENRKIKTIKINHSWGSLEIEGVKLAIYQEDILLRLLVEKNKATKGLNNTFEMHYSLNALAKGVKKSKSGANKEKKKRIQDTLDDFQLVKFKVVRKEKYENNKIYRTIDSIGNIIESWKYDEKNDNLIVRFAPRFWSLFGEGLISGIDLNARTKLSFDCSKILLRFLQTHRNFNQVNMLTLMEALNYNIKQPESYLKRILDKAIQELIKKKHLDKKSGISKKKPYMVFFHYPKKQKKLTNNNRA